MKKTTTLLAFGVAMLLCHATYAQWQLTGNANATSTSILGTTTSVPLRLFTKNTPRLVIDTLGRVGIGITVPTTQLMVRGSGNTPAPIWTNIGKPVFAGFGETNVGNADFILGMASSTLFNAIPRFAGRRSRGTLDVPTAVINGDQLMSFSAFGFDGTTFQNPAAVEFTVDGVQAGTAVPTNIVMATGNNGITRTERLRIGSNGDVAFNTSQVFVKKSTGAVGIGTVVPDGSSLLDISTTAKGVLMPRMTTVQKNAITSPATGLLVYQSDGTTGFQYYNGTMWADIAANAANKTLSNLVAPTAVNVSLLPSPTAIKDLGAATSTWANLYLAKSIFINAERAFAMPANGNAFAGRQSGLSLTTGMLNAGFGDSVLFSITTGSRNAAIGSAALRKVTTGSDNTALGSAALYKNVSGYSNVAIGSGTLFQVTNQSNLVAIGDSALYNNGINSTFNYEGVNNTAVGSKSLFTNTFGYSNAAVGYQSMYSNLLGNYNAALGSASLFSNVNGYSNTAVGSGALYSNVSGSTNVAVGNAAVSRNTDGIDNTGVGYASLDSNTLGGGNTAIGVSTLINNTTGSNNLAAGINADVTANNLTNASAIGANAKVNASNKMRIGDAAVTIVESATGSWTVSDGRFKTDVKEEVKGLAFINLLRPVVYNFDARKYESYLMQNYAESRRSSSLSAMEQGLAKATAIRQSGFIAQEVLDAATKSGYNFNGVHAPENAIDNYSLSYEKLVVPLVKAVQELSAKNEVLQTKADKVDDLQKQIDELKDALLKLAAQQRPSTTSN